MQAALASVAADRTGFPLDEESVRSLTILNLSGDSTLAWGPDNDDVVREVIERKMNQGFAFFIMRRRWTRLLPDRRERVTDIEKAMAARSLSMADELFASIVTGKEIQLVRTPAQKVTLSDGDATLSRNPALIAASQCLAIRHPVGG